MISNKIAVNHLVFNKDDFYRSIYLHLMLNSPYSLFIERRLPIGCPEGKWVAQVISIEGIEG